MARLFADASSEYLLVDTAAVTGPPLTMMAWVYTDDVTGDCGAIGIGANDWSNYYFLGKNDDTANGRVRFISCDSYAQSSVALSANTWTHICGVEYATNSRAVFVGGTDKQTNATPKTPAGLNKTGIGAWIRTANTGYWSGAVAHAAIWNAALTDAEVAALAAGASPLTIRPESLVAYWPLVRTDQDIVGGYDMTAYNTPTWTDGPGTEIGPARVHVGYTTVAGGAPYTLTADAAGSYALTGKDPTLAAARKLALDAGAYTLAGKDAGVLRGYPLAADAGNYTLAGKDPTLIAARALAADAGAYTLAGKDAALTIARLLTADAAGAYTLTGRDATLTYATAGAYTLTADNAGAYALTGHAAGLIAARVLAPDTGVYTLTGADAALVRGFLLALDAGAYTTSGADPTLTAALRLDAGAGAYTTTGQDAALTIARALAAEAGSYVVTGADAGLVLARVLGLDAGAYTVAGKDATLTADVLTDYTLTADAAGAYALTGLPVTIIYSGLVTPDDRIYVVAAEGRVYIVAAESRTHTVAAEGRVYTAA